MPTVLITGGTGLVGSRLSTMLKEKGYTVLLLSRTAGEGHFVWDLHKGIIDKAALQKTDYIIHLAGASVAEKKWTKERKAEIVFSRTAGSALLVKALTETSTPVKAIISASAIGWYGADTATSQQNGFTETDPASSGFLSDTCQQWEAAIDPVQALAIRLVKLRTGIVLSGQGGMLPAFQKPLRAGITTILGNGRQFISWIHIDDLCRMFIYCLEHENLTGVYNAVAPNPVDNKTLALALAVKMKGKFFIPVYVPAFMLRLALGEMSVEVLKSARVSCAKIKSVGFQFYYPSLDAVLNNLVP